MGEMNGRRNSPEHGSKESGPRWLRALVRAILRLYPDDVPGICREEMEETFFDSYRDEPAGGSRARLVAWETFNLAVLAVRERIRAGVGRQPLFGLADDLRFAARALLKRRAFALGAIAMLALGIGVNTAVFSLAAGEFRVVNRFRDPDRLVFLWGVLRGDRRSVSLEEFRAWREQAGAFQEMGVYTRGFRYVTGSGEPLRLGLARTSQNLLPMLGLEAELGRLYGPGDEDPSAPAVAVLTHRLWQERYRGEADVLGRTILLDEAPHVIVGVLPAKVEFEGLWSDVSVFAPLAIGGAAADQENLYVNVIARLAEGVTVDQARAQLNSIAARRAEVEPAPESGNEIHALVVRFRDFFLSSEDRMAWAGILLAVAAVLLIACVNLANLLLAKGVTRQGEVAVRMALGAGRGRVVRQLLTESLLLALLGGGVGLLLGRWGLHVLLASASSIPVLSEEVGLDPALLGYTFAVSVVAALTFGLTPALLASRMSLGESLKVSGTGASSGRNRKRLRSWMLVGQLALAVPLVMTCAVSFLNLRALRTTDFGFPIQGLMSVELSLPPYRYREGAEQARFYRDVAESVRSVPGVAQAGVGPDLPIGVGPGSLYGPLLVEGREDMEGRARGPSGYNSVASDYFQTLGAPLRKGRLFSASDASGNPPVAIVNEAFAHLYWPDQDPLGKRLLPETDTTRLFRGYPFTPAGPITVVGVVADVGADFHGEAPPPALYLSLSQFPSSSATLLVRTSGNPPNKARAIREAISRVDAGVPATGFRTGERAIAEWLRESRTTGGLLGVMAALALGMSIIGLYGLVAHSVAQRTFEIALRVVLGAGPTEVHLAVMRSFVTYAGVGTVIGVLISVALGVVARSFLVLLQVSYVPMVLGVGGLLMGVAIVAAYVPARHATRIEPVVALKNG
jgi:putative ABC transport system permease protein